MSLLVEREAPEVEEELPVTADDVPHYEQRLLDLGVERRKLTQAQNDCESELTELRGKVVLGTASEAEIIRREQLLERSNNLSTDARESQRVVKLTEKQLNRAKILAKHESQRIASEQAALLSGKAKGRMEEAKRRVLEAGAEYCALWGLSENSKSYLASRRERVSGAIDPRELELMVQQIMEKLTKEFLDE